MTFLLNRGYKLVVCIWPAERFYLDSTTFNLKKKSIANISKYFVLISKSGFSLGAKKKKKGNTGAHFPIWQQLNAAFRRTCALELAIAPAAALSHPWLDLPRLRCSQPSPYRPLSLHFLYSYYLASHCSGSLVTLEAASFLFCLIWVSDHRGLCNFCLCDFNTKQSAGISAKKPGISVL